MTVCSGPLGRSVAAVVMTPSPLCPQRLEVMCGFREESVPPVIHAWLLSGAQAAGRAECLEVWTCLLGLLHRDLQELVCMCLFLCFVWHSVRKCVVYAHPAVLNSLCLRGL